MSLSLMKGDRYFCRDLRQDRKSDRHLSDETNGVLGVGSETICEKPSDEVEPRRARGGALDLRARLHAERAQPRSRGRGDRRVHPTDIRKIMTNAKEKYLKAHMPSNPRRMKTRAHNYQIRRRFGHSRTRARHSWQANALKNSMQRLHHANDMAPLFPKATSRSKIGQEFLRDRNIRH